MDFRKFRLDGMLDELKDRISRFRIGNFSFVNIDIRKALIYGGLALVAALVIYGVANVSVKDSDKGVAAAEELKMEEHATYLMETCKSTEYKQCADFPDSVGIVGGLSWKSGFALKNEGYAKFPLDKSYEYVRFVVGQYAKWNEWGDTMFNADPTIVTVWADDEKIYDGLIYYDAVPKQVTAKIRGAEELTFRLVQGPGTIAFGEVTLWEKGEMPHQVTNVPDKGPKTLELVKDLKPYHFEGCYPVGIGHSVKGKKLDDMKINGVEYNYGLVANMCQPLIGENNTKAHFYLQKQFSKLSFIVGAIDGKSHGGGWFTVKADGKSIYEQEVTHDGIARKVVLDITGCDQLSFCTKYYGGDNVYGGIAEIMVYTEGEGEGLAAGEVTEAPIDERLPELPDVTKLMSGVKPFAIGSDTEKQLFKGESDYITFSMGGTKFSEGFILYEAANFMDDNLSSYAIFDLGHEFDHVRFTVGYVGKSWTMYNDTLRVWADDEMILKTPLIATLPNREFVLPLNKCRKLRFENVGQGTMDVAAYGIADIVVYRGDDTSENPFVHPVPECPSEIDLIDLGKPYIHYVAIRQGEENLYDGSTKSKYFRLGDEKIYKGFILRTSKHFSLDFGPLGAGGGAGSVAGAVAAGVSFVPVGAVGGAMIGSTLAGAAALLTLAAGGTAVENSCAAFNTYGEYNSLTFKVGCLKPAFSDNCTGYPESLLIGINGEVAHEIALYDNMEPQTITIPIKGCEQLMFWLANTNEGWSGEFVFYDLELTKRDLPLRIPSEAGGIKPLIMTPVWDAPYDNYDNFVGRVAVSGSRVVDDYIKTSGNISNDLKYILKKAWPQYKITAAFLTTGSGETVKSMRLIEHERGTGFRFFDQALSLEEAVLPKALESLEELQKLYDSSYKEAAGLRAGANEGFRSFTGSHADKYRPFIETSNALLDQLDTLLPRMISQKKTEVAYLKRIMDTRMAEIDGKQSTAYTNYCTLWPEDELPDGALLPLEEYRPKE